MTNPFRDGWTRDDIEAAISRDLPEELLHVPICVSMDPPDCAWAQALCVRLSSHPHPGVRGNAVLGLGHLARTCGALDEEHVRPILLRALTDESGYVRGQAQSAVDDVEHYLGWRLGVPNPLRDWFEGAEVPGARYALNDAVYIVEGEYRGEAGTVVWWHGPAEVPRYTVELASGAGDAEVLEPALRPAGPVAGADAPRGPA